MADYPYDRHDMLRAGYKLLSVSVCKACKEPIEWWKTTNGKVLPFNDPGADQYAAAIIHRQTCKGASAIPKVVTDEVRIVMLGELLDLTRARAIVAIYDENFAAYAWRKGEAAEDIKQDLITATNKCKAEMIAKGERAV